MKKIILLTAFCSFFANALPLAGNYFINKNGSEDYSSIAAAVADLVSNGTSAPVTFSLRSGTYDEAITIDNFSRTGLATDAVVFKRANPMATVIWKNSAQNAAQNWVLKLNGADYISIVNIEFEATNASYQRLIHLVFNADFITLSGNTFTGLNPTSNSDDTSLVYIESLNFGDSSSDFTIDNNAFTGGNYAISTNINNRSAAVGSITNNTFVAQVESAIYLFLSDINITISNNTISSSVLATSVYKAIIALGEISSNNIHILSNGSGILAFGDSSTSTRVFNNVVALTSGSAFGTFGIRAQEYTSIYHNSIRTDCTDCDGLHVNIVTSGSSVKIQNNIVAADGGGVAFSVPGNDGPDAVKILQDNNFFTTGSVLIEWGSSAFPNNPNYADLAAFQADVTFEVGISKLTEFVSTVFPADLHLSGVSDGDLDLIVKPSTDAVNDIDGDVRGLTNTYMGADEASAVTPLDNADTSSGFYTVGGSSPDYTDIDAAVLDLDIKGTKGPVTFKIRAGNYNTHLDLNDIRKINNTDLLLFRNANPSNLPVLLNTASNTSENYIFNIDGSEYIKFLNLNFSVSSQNGFGHVFLLGYDVNNLTIENCTLNGLQSGAADENAALVYSYNQLLGNSSTLNNNQFLNNTLNDGSYAIYLGDKSAVSRYQNTTLSGNALNNQTQQGIYITSSSTVSVLQNNITIASDNAIGLYIGAHNAASLIDSNQINITGNNTIAMRISGNGQDNANRATISNNFLRARTALNMSSNHLWNIYHNTLVAVDFGLLLDEDNLSSGNAVTDTAIFNNIIRMYGNGIAISINNNFSEPANNGFVELDYNNYFQLNNGVLIQWYGLNYTTLADFIAAQAVDINSVNTDVSFVDISNGDLHLSGSSIGDSTLAAVPIGISLDIDGDMRSATFPYMGADEAMAAIATPKVTITAQTPDIFGAQTNENGTQFIYDVVLDTQPTDTVTVNISSDDVSEGSVSSNQLIFTAANWNTPQSFTVTGVDDAIHDDRIYYHINFNVVSNDPDYNAIATSSQTLVNIDNEGASAISIMQLSNGSEASTNASFRFFITDGLVNSQDITIAYTLTGNTTATDGVDFNTLSGSIILPALSVSVDLSVLTIDDNLIENTEIIEINITSATGGAGSTTVTSNNTANASLTDNETGVIQVSQVNNTAEGAANGGFTLSLSGGVSETNTHINISFTGTATDGSDYQSLPSTVIIPVLASSVNIPVVPIDDIDSETDETLIISLDSLNNNLISISNAAIADLILSDNDTTADIAISISPSNPSFTIGQISNLTLTLSNNSPINIYQAVLQANQPAGVSYSSWQCTATAASCSQTTGSGDVADVVNIPANSQIQYNLSALALSNLSPSFAIQANLTPATFLTDSDTSNNTDSVTGTEFTDAIFANGFETASVVKLYQLLTDFDKKSPKPTGKLHFIRHTKSVDSFIEVQTWNNAILYRYLDVDTKNQEISTSQWISNK